MMGLTETKKERKFSLKIEGKKITSGREEKQNDNGGPENPIKSKLLL